MGESAFPIVGIGASAGGIEALQGFFVGLPARPGVAIVIVTHLSPQRDSILNEVVARFTHLAVHLIADGMAVMPDAVYVMPTEATLTIEGGRLRLARSLLRRERKPIDVFLTSLALDRGESAIGVILSGGASDGTLGIKSIKENGGLTLAQTGNGFGPQHPDMPESAITAGFVDFAMPVDQMGAKIAYFAANYRLLESDSAEVADHSDIKPIAASLPDIYAILRNQIGHDFSGYKPKTFARRVRRRMKVTQSPTVEAYIEQLRQEPTEVVALFKDLLINVTNFFRDPEAFERLAAEVVPRLFEGRGADDTVRVWVPACATGEEVYSIGILLCEHMETLRARPRVQIFATDIDDRALTVARAGRYPAPLLDGVSVARRERFFIAEGGSYVVSKDVRDLCVFSPHSVIRDPPFSRIDLVSCRNLLIYFAAEIQTEVIPTFHYALRPNGYLFLGTAETINQFDNLFEPIERRNRIFRRVPEAPGQRMPLILSTTLRSGQRADLIPRQPPAGGTTMRRTVDAQVLERFAPAHVVVNRDGDVVYFSGRTGKYLEHAAGVPTRELMAMARKGLRLDLRAAFRDTVETGRTVTRDGIAVEGEDGLVQMVRLTMEPVIDRTGSESLYLILFDDEGPLLSRDEALTRGHAQDEDSAGPLLRELRETRERLQSIIEEYETALEELKSSNEELVSVNEELQSTNEELEASKEEVQSVNEELHTVNAELNTKVDALNRTNNDLQNLFACTEIATIFLDQTLAIRSFTPPVCGIFNILPGDRGRPITDLTSRFELPDFAADIHAAFSTKRAIERRVEDRGSAKHYLLRLAPYRDDSEQTEGVVATFVNITGLLESEERQRVLIAELQHRTRNLLAVVQSVAVQTLGKGGSLDSFTTRLAALSRVQSLVAATDAEPTDITEIVRQELYAVAGTGHPRISMDGPPAPLRSDQVQTFALALHELATNAVKHGALREEQGRLRVTWQTEQRPTGEYLVLDWQENGVSIPAGAADRVGYGRTLIERSLCFALRAHTQFSFSADGVSCRIEIPLGGPAANDGSDA